MSFQSIVSQRFRSLILVRWQTLPEGFKALVILSLVGLAAMLPAIVSGIPNGADLANHYRFAQPFSEAIQHGNFAPGWLAESNYGLGDPRFRFYPPGLYYLLALGRYLTGNWYAGTLLTFTLLSILGGLGLYFWARVYLAPRWALLAGILYIIVPYHLNEFYQASLLSEYAACSILPFAFAFVARICKGSKGTRDVAGLALSFALLILTHLPLTVIGGLSLLLYALLSLERGKIRVTLSKLALSIGVGLAASAFFWITMISELRWIQAGEVQPNSYYDYSVNFLFSPASLVNRNVWYANLLALAMIGFFLPALALIKRARSSKNETRNLRALAILFALSFLMATALSRPLWTVIPKLQSVQFPWRWLSITSMAGALLLAASLPQWLEKWRGRRLRPIHLIFALSASLSLLFIGYEVVYDCEYLPRSAFETTLRDIRGAQSFRDWLPVGAQPVARVPKMTDKVEAPAREVHITRWETERRAFEVSPGPATVARVWTYYYPHWTATSEGQQFPTRAADDGTLLIELPAQATSVTLEFREPERTRRAVWLSCIGWLAIALLLIFSLRGRVAREYDGVS
jgi:hypothetical protein